MHYIMGLSAYGVEDMSIIITTDGIAVESTNMTVIQEAVLGVMPRTTKTAVAT